MPRTRTAPGPGRMAFALMFLLAHSPGPGGDLCVGTTTWVGRLYGHWFVPAHDQGSARHTVTSVGAAR